MTNLEKSMKTFEEYLQNDSVNIFQVYKKGEKSHPYGFTYSYEKKGFKILVDLYGDEITQHIILDAHAAIEEIIKRTNSYCQMLCEYCQKHSPVDEPGFLYYSDQHGYVQYHITTPFIDRPVSGGTFVWMNNCAWKKLREHIENLRRHASKHFAGTYSQEKTEQLAEIKQASKEGSKATHNSFPDKYYDIQFCKNDRKMQNTADNLYMKQIVTTNMTLHRELRINNTGCIIIAVRTEVIMPEPYNRGMMTAYVNRINASRKITGIHALTKDGYLWISASISLWDGPVSGKTIEHVSSILFAEMSKHQDIIIKCTYGAITEGNNTDSSNHLLTIKKPFSLFDDNEENERKNTTFEDLFGR